MKFEYKVHTVGIGESLIDILNLHGKEGWLLCTQRVTISQVTLIFARQVE